MPVLMISGTQVPGRDLLINLSPYRDEKVKVLKAIPSLSLSSCVLGQYEANPSSEDPDAQMGYLDDATVSSCR